jgi:uncharacterized protein
MFKSADPELTHSSTIVIDMKYRFLIVSLLVALSFVVMNISRKAHTPTKEQAVIVEAARTCLGDVYDSEAYPGGPPPDGRGACTDVVYYALLPHLDLQAAVNQDIVERSKDYGHRPNPDLDYRWCPTLIKWFRGHWIELPSGAPLRALNFQPGDVVFFDDGVGGAGHVGVVSDKVGWDGRPFLIHNPGPVCVEENALGANAIVGHFRMSFD